MGEYMEERMQARMESYDDALTAAEEALAEANARCADLTARLDRERGARVAAEAEVEAMRAHACATLVSVCTANAKDHDAEVGALTASLDECARLLGCERGGVVEALRALCEGRAVSGAELDRLLGGVAKSECAECDGTGWLARDEPCVECQSSGVAREAPTPEPVTWAVGDRVRDETGDVGVVADAYFPNKGLLIEWDSIGNNSVFWPAWNGLYPGLTRLPPEPVVKPASMWCPATRGECDRPCVGAECMRLAPDPRDARIAELERERDEARAKLGRIREQLRGYAGVNASVRGVLRILNEGDV